ncbi:hypothetical protein C8Q76DRAFT_759779 [Earliella scabrosa]|nr:hypothetical protein C8Q76DRAFT_759779 [Earliella scabrosa]
MSVQIVDKIKSTNAIARKLRLTLDDTSYKLGRVDTVSHTDFLKQWKELRQHYESTLEAADTSLIVLSFKINSYLTFHPYLEDSSVLDDLIAEFKALHEAISQLDFKVDDGIASLNIMVSQLSDEFRNTNSDATVRRKVNEIESEVTKLESELLSLQEKVRRLEQGRSTPPHTVDNIVSLIGRMLWGGDPPERVTTSNLRQMMRKVDLASQKVISERFRLKVAKSELEDVDADKILHVMHSVRVDLDALCDVLKEIWVELTAELKAEIEGFLSAAQDVTINSSPENRLVLHHASIRITSSCAVWRERVAVLQEHSVMIL